jgi:ribosomal protein S18 acetylase RimI-like enzyme
MAFGPNGMRLRNGLVYRAETDPAALLQQISTIRALADGEKDALGFIPEAAYRDAIEKRRLLAMCTPTANGAEVVGFVLFSGVFPNARIQQIVVAEHHRRAGIASALINEVVSQLETFGYMTITAAVASDLLAAQGYRSTAFIVRLASVKPICRKWESCHGERCSRTFQRPWSATS